MLYFFDTEFIESAERKTIDLISIGIVAEDGRTYYAVSTDFNPSLASEWVKENVLSKLPAHPKSITNPSEESPRRVDESKKWKSLAKIKDEILEFVIPDENGVEFWAAWAAYDWVAFCWIFGTMMDLPENYPYYCNDVIQWMHQLRLERSFLPPSPIDEHNALADAQWVKDVYYVLKQYSDNLDRLKRRKNSILKDGSH